MKTILIIEDNPDIRENTLELLELEGFNVITAENGRTGWDAIVTNKPDVVICDIMMPELDGYEVMRRVKNTPSIAGIPVIYLTASAEKKDIQKAMEMGAAGYVKKPFDTPELLSVVLECLSRKR